MSDWMLYCTLHTYISISMALFTLLLVVVKSAEMKASKGKKGERKGKKKDDWQIRKD